MSHPKPPPYGSPGALMSWEAAVSFGRVPGYDVAAVHGVNVLVGGTEVDVWGESGKFPWLGSAEILNLTSTDAADAADGTGARTVELEGLGTNLEEIEEEVSLDGTTDAPTEQEFYRVNAMRVLTTGAGETAAGIIRATADSAGTVQSHIRQNANVAQGAQYTVPAGKLIQVAQLSVGIHKLTGGGSPSVIFHFEGRDTISGGPWLEMLREHLDVGVLDYAQFNNPVWPAYRFTAGWDFNVHALSTAANTDVRAGCSLIVGPAT